MLIKTSSKHIYPFIQPTIHQITKPSIHSTIPPSEQIITHLTIYTSTHLDTQPSMQQPSPTPQKSIHPPTSYKSTLIQPCLSSSCCFSRLLMASWIGSPTICCSINSCCAKSKSMLSGVSTEGPLR